MNTKKEPEFDELLAAALNEVTHESRVRLLAEIINIHNETLHGMTQSTVIPRWHAVVDKLQALVSNKFNFLGEPASAAKHYTAACPLCGVPVHYTAVLHFSIARHVCDCTQHNSK